MLDCLDKLAAVTGVLLLFLFKEFLKAVLSKRAWVLPGFNR